MDRRIAVVAFAALALSVLAGCASAPEPEDPAEAVFPQVERWWR